MKLLYLLLFISSFLNSQTKVDIFPNDQHSYLGGRTNFYKDFQKVLLEKKLKPCANKNEFLSAYVVVLENDTAVLYDPEKLQKSENQCARELTKEVVKNMPGWVSAKIDGNNKAAVAQYYIYPDAFFDNFKTGYNAEDLIVLPTFPGGINSFRNEVLKRTDVDNFYVKSKGKATVVITFSINTGGEVENLKLENSSGLKEYDDMILESITSIKKKWKPATVHGNPIKYSFRLPFTFFDI
ncbi:MAG: energy transducer TonB [Flavobacteriia bacterium]|nr:energy transducer TonB [Flavobacteriia bacterium]MBH2023256.1 energy transducer TonB [Flavobacteriales bacterium]